MNLRIVRLPGRPDHADVARDLRPIHLDLALVEANMARLLRDVAPRNPDGAPGPRIPSPGASPPRV